MNLNHNQIMNENHFIVWFSVQSKKNIKTTGPLWDSNIRE